MKTLLGLLAGMLVTATALAGSADQFILTSTDYSASVVTNASFTNAGSVTSTSQYDGFIQQIELISGFGLVQTCSVVIATAPAGSTEVERVIYSNLTVTSSSIVSPRLPVHDTAGVALGFATNSYEPVFIVGEKLKMYIWKSTGTSNCTIKARVKLWR